MSGQFRPLEAVTQWPPLGGSRVPVLSQGGRSFWSARKWQNSSFGLLPPLSLPLPSLLSPSSPHTIIVLLVHGKVRLKVQLALFTWAALSISHEIFSCSLKPFQIRSMFLLFYGKEHMPIIELHTKTFTHIFIVCCNKKQKQKTSTKVSTTLREVS